MYGEISPRPELYEDTTHFNPALYSIGKAGLLALTRYVASFWGEFNIRCNAISPGALPKSSVDDDFVKRLEGRTSLKRIGLPEDLIGALLYLSSDASTYLTGQSIRIDGGWY
jgi:NAD(P)-dependent dehydrogenase (short-subunit alcohol dehydrogenase family)